MLKRLLKTKRSRTGPSGPAHSRLYAIGDVHGRLDLMVELLERIRIDNAGRAQAKTYLVMLGDLVDRGPDSKGVVDYLLAHPPMTGRAVYIRGNHEEFFLGALAGNLSMLQDWLIYGGAECAASYGVSEGWILNSTVEAIRERLVDNVPKAHINFLSSMADSFKFGDYLLVHAGIRPGVPFDQQVGQDLRWIREDFLESNADHGMVVVHGHTIAEEPEIRSNRIGIDTGAYRTGVLTALAIEGGDRWFLEAIGQPG